mmetsp:Transcript_9576/g.19403  ORF Transcript_9576/g.19403 Transcript_9576/m.19403 type:complete len:450 (+) Transcript_9576:2-1351(+)
MITTVKIPTNDVGSTTTLSATSSHPPPKMNHPQQHRRHSNLPHGPSSPPHFPVFPVILILLSNLLAIPSFAKVYPLQHEIRRRQTHCIYEHLAKNEFVTFSTFIVDSSDDSSLSAAVQIEGPVARSSIQPDFGGAGDEQPRQPRQPQEDEEEEEEDEGEKKASFGSSLQKQLQNWPKFMQDNRRRFQEAGIIHHALHIDFTYSGESEDAIMARAEFTRQQQQHEEEQRREREERRTRAESEVGDDNSRDEDEFDDAESYEDDMGKIHQIMPDKIEPYEWTKLVKSPGWYRMCVQAPSQSNIAVEMDIRAGNKFGGVDPDTGHVYGYAALEDREEEERLNKLAEMAELQKKSEPTEEELAFQEEIKNQVKEFDLELTNNQLREIHSLTTKIMRDQAATHKRIKGHEMDARRNYRRIVRSGWMETGLYVLITGYQVYTIHRWLLSNSILGR